MMGHRLCPQSHVSLLPGIKVHVLFLSFTQSQNLWILMILLPAKQIRLCIERLLPSPEQKPWNSIRIFVFFFFKKKPSAYICMSNLNNEKEKNRQSNPRSRINLNAEKQPTYKFNVSQKKSFGCFSQAFVYLQHAFLRTFCSENFLWVFFSVGLQVSE